MLCENTQALVLITIKIKPNPTVEKVVRVITDLHLIN
jgi:hypothetical protein